MSPVTEELIGQIPATTDADVATLLAAAQSARRTWAAIAAWDRAAILRRISDILRNRNDDIAQMMSRETGKPIAEALVEKFAVTKFRNCGQVCISPSCFYVHRSILTPFEAAFASVARCLVVGDGLLDGVTTGPMIRARSLTQALRLVEDACSKGARLLAGGNRDAGFERGHFLEPTVLSDVPDEAVIMIEEPFAPVAPIAACEDFDDVITRVNATPFGLASYVFTHDSALAAETAWALEAGMVGIGETLLATAEAPFGDIEESGFGREGGRLGIFDYLVPKYVRHKLVRGSMHG